MQGYAQETQTTSDSNYVTFFENNFNRSGSEDFNQGLITDPLHLVQGQFSALVSARPGNDPNGQFDFRSRGIKSFELNRPLIIVDGIPMATLEGIHPQDIESIEILPNGGSLPWFGMQGGRGVLSVTTKRGKAGRLRVTYQTVLASEKVAKTPDLAGVGSYRRNGGDDLESYTDWWQAITRSAQSQQHHLSISGGSEQTHFYIGANYDQLEGVVKNSDFDRLAGRMNLEHFALNERLRIRASIVGSFRNSSLTPYVAMKYATQYNPTAPIYGEGAAFERFGGYFEKLLFDNYNPLSILEQNQFDFKYNNLQTLLELDLNVVKGLNLQFTYSNQEERFQLNSFFPSTSFYIGMGRNGLAQQQQKGRDHQFYKLQLQYNKVWGNWNLKTSIGTFRRETDLSNLNLQGSDFLTNAFSYNNLSAAQSFSRGEGVVENVKYRRLFESVYGTIRLSQNNQFGVEASINWDGASQLGINNKRGLFFGINGYAQVHEQLLVRASYGQRGNLPQQGNLSKDLYEETSRYYNNFYYNGNHNTYYIPLQEPNPDLKWETVREWTLGVDFNLLDNRLNGILNFYANRADDLISEIYLNGETNLGFRQFVNGGAITNSGLEIGINYDLIRNDRWQWQVRLSGTRFLPSKLKAYNFRWEGQNEEFIGILGDGCNYPIFRMAEGIELGEIWSFLVSDFGPVTPNGSWNFIDTNDDGYFSPDDYRPVGNALPKSALGFANEIRWKKWRIDFMLRGVFGHDVVNHIKSFYSAPVVGQNYNVLKSGLRELRGLEDWVEFSERDVERGSFLRLDYITFNYTFDLPKTKAINGLDLFLTAQNLFTITGYSGLDPEFKMVDRNSWNPAAEFEEAGLFVDASSPLTPGMDRRNIYPTTRIFSVGFKLIL